MFIIEQDEAFALKRKFPGAVIKICSARKSGSGKTYWCSEERKYHEFIENMRNKNVTN